MSFLHWIQVKQLSIFPPRFWASIAAFFSSPATPLDIRGGDGLPPPPPHMSSLVFLLALLSSLSAKFPCPRAEPHHLERLRGRRGFRAVLGATAD